MKPLDVKQTAFKADEITYLDRKAILLDRMLLNLFELLRFDGRPAIRRRKRTIDIDTLVKLIQADPNRFPGFADQPDVARAWLTNDLFEIMNRGKGARETVVGPRPFHLNAYKLTNAKAVQDHGASRQVWAMLFHADPEVLTLLKAFFGKGLDPVRDQYDRTTVLDLETLAVLGLVDQVTVDPATVQATEPLRPLCTGQGHLMADDLRRLLAYEGNVPRHVLADYIRTILGLHLALFVLRLLKLLPDWVDRASRRLPCLTCPVEDGTSQDIGTCPYHFEMVVDLTDDPGSPPAALAKESAAEHFGRLARYVRAVILINRLKDFAAMLAAAGTRPPARSVRDLLALLEQPPAEMDGFYGARISDVLSTGPDEQEEPIVTAILRQPGLSPLEKYVEMICLKRMKNERSRLVTLIDALTQKNKPGGFLRQTSGARSPRWFVLGSNLLETLVQIAVLDRDAQGRLNSRSLLLDDFIAWLRTRYGFVIYAPAHREVGPEEQDAWRRNEIALRERLRQIGFFSDLSDAYNSQTLRPRYEVTYYA